MKIDHESVCVCVKNATETHIDGKAGEASWMRDTMFSTQVNIFIWTRSSVLYVDLSYRAYPCIPSLRASKQKSGGCAHSIVLVRYQFWYQNVLNHTSQFTC